MSVLFALGSLCFTVAALTAQWASVSRPGIGVTFFVGSLLFTSAAYLQYSETVNVERGLGSRARRHAGGRPRGNRGGSTGSPRRSSWSGRSSSTSALSRR